MHVRGRYKAALVVSTGGHLPQVVLPTRKTCIRRVLTWSSRDDVQFRRTLARVQEMTFGLCIGFRSWRNALQIVRPAFRALPRVDRGLAVTIFLGGPLTAVRSVHVGNAFRFGRMVEAVPQLRSPRHGRTWWHLRTRSRWSRPGRAFATLTQAQVDQLNTEAGACISRASAGSTPAIPAQGEASVLLSPRVDLENHDDHQLQITTGLVSRRPSVPVLDDQSASWGRVIAIVPLDVSSTRAVSLRRTA